MMFVISVVFWKRGGDGTWALVPDVLLDNNFDGMDDFIIPVPADFATC